MQPLLEIRNLTVTYPSPTGDRTVLRDVNLTIHQGEILGIIGESGAGKTTLAMAILNLVRFYRGRASGEIWFEGKNLLELDDREMRPIRGNRVAMVMQNAPGALDPLYRIGDQIAEVIRAHQIWNRRRVWARVEELVQGVRLAHVDGLLRRHPHELSGGEAQRVLLAMALANRPQLLIAYEPTASLDKDTEVDILDLIKGLCETSEMSVLFITHDREALARLTSTIFVLKSSRP